MQILLKNTRDSNCVQKLILSKLSNTTKQATAKKAICDDVILDIMTLLQNIWKFQKFKVKITIVQNFSFVTHSAMELRGVGKFAFRLQKLSLKTVRLR